MSSSRKQTHQISFTATETVSLPSDDPLVMGIRSRDWTRLRKAVESLSNNTNAWELVFTVSTTVFFSFLLPAITTTGGLKGWKLIFAAISLTSVGVGLTSLIALIAARSQRKTDRADVIDLMNDIQSLYGTDKVEVKSIQLDSENKLQNTHPVYDDNEELYEDAKKIAYSLGKVSTSLLQRKLRIGYGRASRIVDQMEKDGIAGASDGARPREVFVAPDDVSNRAKDIIDNQQ